MSRKPPNSHGKSAKKAHRADTAVSAATPTVSGRWLLKALGISIAAAALCLWLAACLLFWQGSWQLLYQPTAQVARTPASAGIAFDPVAFAATAAGEPRLKGWWIPAAASARYSRLTVLYLHGRKGNLGDAVQELAALHAAGVQVLAFDYQGYGESQFTHPSEASWRQDAEWALSYLTATRHVAAGSIVVDGRGLGADLALEVAAAHPELAGVVVDEPLVDPAKLIFNDPRARLVPARLLVRDRWSLSDAAARVTTPVLWLDDAHSAKNTIPGSYQGIGRPTTHGWLDETDSAERQGLLSRWLDDLPASAHPASAER